METLLMRSAVCAALLVSAVPLAAGGGTKATGPGCVPDWIPTFGGAPGTIGAVQALAVFDDGSGSALYAAGELVSAGGQAANFIARWDGGAWSPLGSGLNHEVKALTVFDDGSGTGPALCAAGNFPYSAAGDSYIARRGCPAIDALPGCFGNPAALDPLSDAAALGGTLEVSLAASGFASGLGLLYLGFPGIDAAGCGLLAPGLGELLLAVAPLPLLVGSGGLAAGAVAFALPVPGDPGLVGLDVALQGAAVGNSAPGLPLELSNALRVTITQ
jgi:hypothetical protein